MRRVVMLGVAGLNPTLVKRWIADLPAMLKMRTEGVWADLSSTVPPLSPQAWITAFSGRNPGAYGAWGSTARSDHAYRLSEKVSSKMIDERIRPLYRILPGLGQRVGVVNVPATSPAPDVAAGFCVGRSALVQDDSPLQTWPEELAGEVREKAGDYIQGITLPTEGRSGIDGKSLLEKIREMDAQRFRLVKYFVEDRKCDAVMAVVDGTELVSHLFLRDADASHPYHEKDTADREVLHDYYRWIDERTGEIADSLDEDTVLCLFSVSAVAPLSAVFNLNEWLIEKGYLRLNTMPAEPAVLKELDVDWEKTACWAMGEGGQIYVNLEGREAQGTVASDEYMPLLERLKRELTEDVKAAVLFRNESCFGPLSPVGPDLFLHFARGDRRTDERVGFGRIEDTGRAKSSPLEGYSGLGYLSIAGSDFPAGGDLSEVSVLDIAPTVIDIMNLRAPYGVMAYELEGYSLLRDMRDSARAVQPDEGKEVKEEDKVRSRLEALGY